MAGEDRTEAATPRRLQRARETGHIPISREVSSLAGLGAAWLILALVGPSLGHSLLGRLEAMLTAPPQVSVAPALMACCLTGALVAGPIVLGVLLASTVGTLLQTGLAFNPGALRPDFGRLSPLQGLKRLFGTAGLIEAGKATVKLAVLGLAVYHVLSGSLAPLQASIGWLPSQSVSRFWQVVFQLAKTVIGAQLVIAGVDIVWVRHRHAKQLRMTKEDVRQDTRDADGNPQIKQRLRQIRLTRSRKRMLAAVPKATVVVTNPTHYAVALAYDRSKGGAPRVVAKGMDEVAARIREVAQDSRVPLVANPPLARALYAVELDAEIPAEHFKVVAELIAYVWRLSGRVGVR